MLQAALPDCLFLDLLSHLQDFGATAVMDVDRGEVAEAIVVPVVGVVLDEGTDLAFQIAGQKVVLQQDAVLHGLVPELDLALGLRMMRCTADMIHALVLKIEGQIGRHVG